MSKKLKMWPMRRPLDWQIVPLIGIIDDIKPKPILSKISDTTKPIIKTVEPALPKARTSIENPPQSRAAEPLQSRAAEPLQARAAETLLMPAAEPLFVPAAEPLFVPEVEPLLMPAAEPSVDKQMVLQLAMEAEEAKKKATELFNASLKQRQAEILRQVAAKKEEERKEAEALALQAQAADALKVAELQNAERMRIQLEKEAEQLLLEEAKQKQIELDLAMQKAADDAKEAKEKAREAADINIHQPRQNVELTGTDVPTNMRPTNMRPANMRPANMRPANMRPANMRPANMTPEKEAKVEFKPLMADSQLNAIERIVKARGDKVSDSIANYPRGPNKPHREGKEFRPANKKGGTRKIKKKSKKTKKNIYKTKKDKNIKTRKNVTKKYTIKKKDARRFNSRK